MEHMKKSKIAEIRKFIKYIKGLNERQQIGVNLILEGLLLANEKKRQLGR